MVNILGARVHKAATVLDIVDCTKHMSEGGVKSVPFIADLFWDEMEVLDPNHELIDLLFFDGASNMQKAGEIIAARNPCVTCFHGHEHVMSLLIKDIINGVPLIQLVACGGCV